tara:strand:+ start:7337 stop:7840 length:504 start_codon:yes stop_codon:yes gene_type:complete
MAASEYSSTQLLTTTINILPQKIKGDINKLLLSTIKKKYEGVCNKDGYVHKGSIELINRSIGKIKMIDNVSYIIYSITYRANIISPSEGNKISCIISSNNKMGLIGYIKSSDSDTIKDSPFIIIIPREYFEDDIIDGIKENDKIDVVIENYRTKYLGKQIQIVAKPV